MNYQIDIDTDLESEEEFEMFDALDTEDMALELKTKMSCSCPPPSPPPKGLFSPANRKGHRWYTPRRGDNLWNLSKNILIRILADKGISRQPNGGEIMDVMNAIRNHDCNKHLKGIMFLPRFKRDRCTRGGLYYGVIYIPFKFH